MKVVKRKSGGVFMALALLVSANGASGAEPVFPSKPIRFLLPLAPGGIGDITARIVARKMSENIGHQVVVENRPGAGMIFSATAARNANPDGYTMILAGNGTAISQSLFKSLPYDILKDFAQVATLASFDLVLVVGAESKIANVADMLIMAKNNPGRLNLGTVSPGSTQFLAAELFKSVTGISAQTVPYKATPDIVVAARSNTIDVGYDFIPALLGQLKANAIRALGVAASKRFPGLPDVPTMAEAGVPNYLVSSWNGVSVRADTPGAIVERLNKEITAAVNAPDVRQQLQDLGALARPATAREAREFMVAEIARWKKVIEDAKIDRQ